MNKQFVLFVFLLQIIFLTPYGLTEEKTYDWSKKSEELMKEMKEERKEREEDRKEREEEMKEEQEYLENTKTIKDEGDGVYRKIYENGKEYLCIRESSGGELCEQL